MFFKFKILVQSPLQLKFYGNFKMTSQTIFFLITEVPYHKHQAYHPTGIFFY